MIIVWGTKRSRKNLGFAADFCPICRQVRGFRVRAVRLVSHVYYIPLGRGKLAGHEATCQSCGVTLYQDEETPYQQTVKSPPSDLEQLVFETYPGVRSDHAPRLQIEEQIARGGETLDPTLRRQLLQEPFATLAPAVEERFAETHFDRPTGIGCLVTILVPFLLMVLGGAILKGQGAEEVAMLLGSAAFAIGLVYTLVRLAMAPRSYIRAEVLPKLAMSLTPLQPTEAELTGLLDELRRMKLQIGKRVKPTAVLEAIADHRPDAALRPR